MEFTEKPALRIFFLVCTILIIGTFAAGFVGLILSMWLLAGLGYGVSLLLSAICGIFAHMLKTRSARESTLGKNLQQTSGKIVAIKKALDLKSFDVYVDIDGKQACAHTKIKNLKVGQTVTVFWDGKSKACKIKKTEQNQPV